MERIRNENPLVRGVVKFLASGAYLGYLPFYQGTWGTLWGVPLSFWLSTRAVWVQVSLVVLSALFAVFLAERAEVIWGQKDPSKVVVDEIIGYLVSLAGLPFTWSTAILGFLIFRFLDIVKPFPARRIDLKTPGGWGVVLDDVMVGLYTNGILRVLLFYKVLEVAGNS